MHQPLPHGYFGPDDLTAEDSAFAERLMRRLTNIKQLGGLGSLRFTQALPSGNGTVTALDMGGVRKVFVRRPVLEATEEETSEGGVPTDVPMLFSGVVKKSRIEYGEKITIGITPQTQKRLGHYGKPPASEDTRYSTAAEQTLERFTIPLSMRFYELMPKNPGSRLITQYEDLRPSWYSGMMAAVVQIVSGYGKREFKVKPKDKTELAKMQIPPGVSAKIEAELKGYRLFSSTGKTPADGCVRFDYKHPECHAVSKGPDGTRWLVRVSRAGVYAMPLPMIPATTTRAFREWIEEVGDSEIKWCLDNLGGMPSGESFPTDVRVFRAWERAGVIVKVCGAGTFYDHMAFSAACGWSFNQRGDMAYNTCFDYDEDEGFAYGLLYSMHLSMGALKKKEPAKPLTDVEKPLMSMVVKYVSAVRKEAERDPVEGPAAIYKLEQATFTELAARAKSSTSGDLKYWINLQAPAVASHSGRVSEESRGWLYTPNQYEFQPQLKFAEPTMQGCVSFDFRPLLSGRAKRVKCDSPVYAFFSRDDTLHIVKYFFDPEARKGRTDSDLEECMTVGTWTQTSYGGDGSIQGDFYSNEIDDRKVVSTKSVSVITGTDLGYSVEPYHTPFYSNAMTGTVGRRRYFARKIRIVNNSESMKIAVCIPFYSRGSILFARRDWQGHVETSESVVRMSVDDPNKYEYYTEHDVEAKFITPSVPDWRSRVAPRPEKGSPIYGRYAPPSGGGGQCADFADGGPWLGSGQVTLDGTIGPVVPGWGAGDVDVPPPCNEYNTRSYNDPDPTGKVQYEASGGSSTIHTEEPSVGYFTNSPNTSTGVFRRTAVNVTAGEAEYDIVSEKYGAHGQWVGGYTRMADNTQAHHFIGVINE